jgi:hypothetical protein
MREKQRRQQWALTCLVLLLTMPALAEVTRVGEERKPLPGTRLQVTQTLTVAVCGDECNCGAALLITRVPAPCSVTSSAGQCNIGSGKCCLCAPN